MVAIWGRQGVVEPEIEGEERESVVDAIGIQSPSSCSGFGFVNYRSGNSVEDFNGFCDKAYPLEHHRFVFCWWAVAWTARHQPIPSTRCRFVRIKTLHHTYILCYVTII